MVANNSTVVDELSNGDNFSGDKHLFAYEWSNIWTC